MSLTLTDIHVAVDGKEVVHGVSLDIGQGEIHALMGPNGSGKSSLSYALVGHPHYAITKGSVMLDGKDITNMTPDERARAGLFLSFQYPVEIPGVSVQNFLRTAKSAKEKKEIDLVKFYEELTASMAKLSINSSFAHRSINEGFSGGEKKRMEMLQLHVLEPRYAILDETDSGLDVDALKIISQTVNAAASRGAGVLLITHYNRILQHIKPTKVHVLSDGLLVATGEPELAERIEKEGYAIYGTKK